MNFSGCQVTEASEERLSSIDHIISAIQGLEAVTCRLELVLSRRLDRCRGRLGAVTDRLNAVENRIEKLCDSHRGILVLAPTKRPGRSELSLFHDFLLIEKRPIELSNNTVNDFLVRRQDRTAEKQLYYNVKVMKPQLSSTASLNLSSALWSVSNFLLFNSSFSPFQGCPTKLVSSSIELPSNIQNVRMASVSVSTRNEILDGDRLDRFNYTPGLSSVPQFEVPESLPDLPGSL